MLQYEEFKHELMEALPACLPACYQDWKIECREVMKVNCSPEAIHVTPPDGCGGSPTLYVEEFYTYYKSCGSMEETCRKAAAIFVLGMDYLARANFASVLGIPKDRIIFALIPQNGNERLLAEVPHRLTMDLAVIYRIVIEAEDGSLNSAVINNTMLQCDNLTEDDLYQLAMENTPKILPAEIDREHQPLYMVTNCVRISGASVMLYPGVLASVAKEVDSDLFILPSSLQEVFVIPDMGQDAASMNRIVVMGNETTCNSEEILSDHVYYYHKDDDKVCIPQW